jgi:hypothetical protein
LAGGFFGFGANRNGQAQAAILGSLPFAIHGSPENAARDAGASRKRVIFYHSREHAMLAHRVSARALSSQTQASSHPWCVAVRHPWLTIRASTRCWRIA